MASGDQVSEVEKSYRVRFYNHLTDNRDDRRHFMRAYGPWLDVRINTIEEGKVAAWSSDKIERNTTFVKCGNGIIGAGADLLAIGNVIGYVSPMAVAVSKAASMVSNVAFAATSVFNIERTNTWRAKFSSTLENDCSQSSELFNFGLDYRYYYDAVKNEADEFQKMTISGRLQEHYRKPPRVSLQGLNIQQQAREVIDVIPSYILWATNMVDIRKLLENILKDNPQIKGMCLPAFNLVLDYIVFRAMGSINTGDLSTETIVDILNGATFCSDAYTVCATRRSLIAGKSSITGEKISDLLTVLSREKDFVIEVYNRLVEEYY